jgi:hypothetical protein
VIVDIPNYKIPTEVLVEELFERVDDSIYAPEPRADDFIACLSGGQREMLYDILKAVIKKRGEIK